MHAGINPIAHGNATSSALGNLRLVVRMIARHLKTLAQTNAFVRCAHHVGVALFHGIHQSEVDRIHTQLGSQFGNGELKAQRYLWDAWRAIRMDFGFVCVDRTAGGARVGQLVTRRGHKGGDTGGVTVVGSGVHEAFDVGGHQLAITRSAQLDLCLGTRRRASGTEHVAAIHHHLHGAAGLLCEHHGKRLEIHGRFTAKTTADFRGRHLDCPHIHAGDGRGVMTHRKVPLSTAPQIDATGRIDTRHAGVGFDIPLVTHGHRVSLLYHDLSSFKGSVWVTHGQTDMRGKICRFLGITIGKAIIVQNRRIRSQRFVHVSDGW